MLLIMILSVERDHQLGIILRVLLCFRVINKPDLFSVIKFYFIKKLARQSNLFIQISVMRNISLNFRSVIKFKSYRIDRIYAGIYSLGFPGTLTTTVPGQVSTFVSLYSFASTKLNNIFILEDLL